MRLVCPNCDAEYEVDASVIPDTGRDVQCSNCGHAWFQLPPALEADLEAEAALHDAPPAAVTAQAARSERVASKIAAELDEEDDTSSFDNDEDDDGDEPADAVEAAAVPASRSIDESVLAVLREEAEREAEARRNEAPPVEIQPDLGLQAAGAATATTRRISRLKGEPEPVTPQVRRDLLPEVEELNSSLRAGSEKRGGDADAVADTLDRPAAPRRSSFRSGFTLMLLLAMIGAAIYLMAPQLSAQFPAAAPSLKAYVVLVDQGRVALNGWVQSAIAYVQGLIGKSG